MSSIRQVARILSRQPTPPVRLRQALVDAVHANGTVNLTIDGEQVVNVPCLSGAVPVAGPSVMVAVNGRDMFVLGSVAGGITGALLPSIQYGVHTVANTGASTTSVVTWPYEFNGQPVVTLTCSRGATSSKPYIVNVRDDNVTYEQATFRVSSFDGSSNSENVTVQWIAVRRGE